MGNASKATLARPSKVSVNIGDCFSDFASWLVVTCLIVSAIVGLAFALVNKNHDIKNMRKEIENVKKENDDLGKQLQCCVAELERQKSSKLIIAQAERLGLRPARGQQVEHLRMVQNQQAKRNWEYCSTMK